MGNPSEILARRPGTKIAFVTAVVIAAAVPVVWQEYAITRTRLEIRNQTKSGDQAVSPPTALRSPGQGDEETRPVRDDLQQRADLNRLRTEVPALRARLEEARERGAALAAAKPAIKDGAQNTLPPGFTRLSDAREVGSFTATDMFQSMSCALTKADTNRIAKLSTFSSPEAQQKMALEMVSIANNQTANLFSDMAYRVVREVPLANGDVAMVTDMWQSGRLRREAFRTRRVGAEWRQVIGDDGNPETVDLGPDLNSD